MFELGTELGFDREEVSLIVQYLAGENLVKHRTIGGGIGITHDGVKKVEEAISAPQESTRPENNKETALTTSDKTELNEPLVFISYDTRDIELVRAIDGVLQRVFNGKVKTFIAKRDIKPGYDAFKTMLHENLANCSIVLAICTEYSRTSPWLWFESGAGFGKSTLIPIWSGVSPQEFKPPMTIFQGKNIEDKSEVNELLTRIAEITNIGYDEMVSDDEFDALEQISKKLSARRNSDETGKIEELVEYPLAAPNESVPVQYLIEAHFPVSKAIPLQRLNEIIEKSTIKLKSTERRFSYSYPDLSNRLNKSVDKDVMVINTDLQNPFSNEQHQTAFIKSGVLTLTYWTRQFRWDAGDITLIEASEINEYGALLLLFFRNIALNLNLSSIKVRIRLFDLQNGLVHSDKYLQKSLQSYRAPTDNDLEIEHEISIDNSSKEEIAELLMHVWENFRASDGNYPNFNEKEFLSEIVDY